MTFDTRINNNWTVNEVIETWPDTIAVFNSFGVDSCCGGNLTLAEAAADAGTDANELLAAVTRAAEATVNVS